MLQKLREAAEEDFFFGKIPIFLELLSDIF